MSPFNIEALISIKVVIFDFDGVFTDNAVFIDQDGKESVRCWRSDGLGIARLKEIGVHVLIVSTEVNPVVTARAKKLRIECKQGIENKALAIKEMCCDLGVALNHVMFVGNDINDIPALKLVGLPVGVADSYPEILPHVIMQTSKPGGYGAVREVCDLIFHAKKQTPSKL
jgi:YrbI family 3-deoxy-D-manno-octulosonate 8-phosphate phosphatase